MGYWKSKVVPTIKKLFEKNPAKKAAAAEACKTFEDSKESINKEIEEKKTELEPKVLETYEAASAEVKALVRDPKDAGLKKNSVAVQKYLEELVKIEFPGSKAVSDATSSFGAGYVAGPVTFIFEKVSVFLPVEEKPREVPVEEVKTEEPVKSEETSGEKEKEIVEEKKEEVAAVPEVATEEKKPEVVEEVKKEETPAPTPEAAPVAAPVAEPTTKAPETTTEAPKS